MQEQEDLQAYLTKQMSKEKLTIQQRLALQMFQKPACAIAKLRNKQNNDERQMDNEVTWSLAMHSNIDKAYELVGIQWNLKCF